MAARDDTRQRVLEGAFECIARRGMAKTTVDDVAAASGVSRATIYRIFPGGKDEVLRDTVGWEMDRFFLRLGEELGDAADFPEFLERALPLARRELLEHAVLQKVLETEPDRLNALITRAAGPGRSAPSPPTSSRCSSATAPPAGSPPTPTSPRWRSTWPGCRCRSSPRPAATTSPIRPRCAAWCGASCSAGCSPGPDPNFLTR